jgi:hypothetical protein
MFYSLEFKYCRNFAVKDNDLINANHKKRKE